MRGTERHKCKRAQNMPDEPSLQEVVANKTGIEPDQYYDTLRTKLKKDTQLQHCLTERFPFRILAKYWTFPNFYHKTLVNDLRMTSSWFLNRFGAIYPVPEIPSPGMDDADDSEPMIKQIFDEFPFFKFGGVPFVCSHDYLWNNRPGQNSRNKDVFEIRYGIKLSDVYISLYELQSVASFNSLFSMIDDFFVTGNYDDTVLTIFDNDLPYGAKDSSTKHECHFKPIFCIDQGVPVRYIKTVSDNNNVLFSRQYESEQRHKYTEQRKFVLTKLGEFYKTSNPNDYSVAGYPTDIDFIVKTGLHEFTFLSYDRFSKQGNFLITNIRYDNNTDNLQYTMKKCTFIQMPGQINAIQRARAMHFNKMYGPKNR